MHLSSSTRATQPTQTTTAASRNSSLTALADSGGLSNVESLAIRLNTINEVFNRADDRRGLFTAVYAPSVKRLVHAVQSGAVQDVATAERLMLALGKRYLAGLAAHIEGRPSTWDSFYRVAAEESESDTRVLASSFNAHLTLDLVEALVEIRAPASFAPDLQIIGQLLADEVTAQVASPNGPNGQRLTTVMERQGLVRVFDRVFGVGASFRTGMATVLSEASASTQFPWPVQGARARWSVREQLLSLT